PTIPSSAWDRSSPSWPPWAIGRSSSTAATSPAGRCSCSPGSPARSRTCCRGSRRAPAMADRPVDLPVRAIREVTMNAGVDLYLDLMMRCLADWLYDNFDESIRAEGLDWPARAHTMIGLKRLANVRCCLERVLADGVPGDVIETGAWRGGTTIFM